MVYPTRYSLVIPSDSPKTQSEIDQMCAQLHTNVGRINDWYEEQIEHRFIPEIKCWRSNLTHLELASSPPDPHIDQNWCDEDHWVGMHETSTSREIRRHHYGSDDWRIWTEGAPGTQIRRMGTYVDLGGGFAGGRSVLNIDQLVNTGHWYLGDWEIFSETFGFGEHCCVIWKGVRFCTRSIHNPGLSFGHEELHGWFAGNIHSPVVIWLGTDWLPEHRENVLKYNIDFLEPVGGGTTPPPPTEEPPPEEPPTEEPPEDPHVVATKFTPNPPLKLRIGRGRQMKLRALFSDGDTWADVTEFADWGSSDENVATVNPQGYVRGISEGSAEIMAHVGGHDPHFVVEVR